MEKRKKIGITGQNGFVGTHLKNTLRLFSEEFETIDFRREWFGDEVYLDSFVKQCDVVVHLAALNRHNDPQTIYQSNVDMVLKLVGAFERTTSTPHVVISSSTQEEKDNMYGKSKKEGRELLEKWSKTSGASFTGMVIPNVFGPFGHPFYNSVVATFCYQISRGETPRLDVDGNLKLIYVTELVAEILKAIRQQTNDPAYLVDHTAEATVSEILGILNRFKSEYHDKGNIPILKNTFEFNLFNTYRCFMDLENYFPRKFKKNSDPRGTFVELARLGIGGQVSFSTTVPGITRGNHFHTRKIERFAVIKGKALIQLRRVDTNTILDFFLDGEEPGYVDMPVWYTHNIKNIGEEELITVFWINEPYDPNDPDTYFVNV
ncbi:NAD-dependent epimerase/dehydratase family protein [Aquiflexum sp. LQ15W]|uniref:polysaccharide biosynthesis C-terminal domain-containing protein n=1 Tax=Cognataquiflexum nitidum TaxID=2922272 RepID=UPI001F13F951|nr:NAD-dependent epimerase/dehydratase family protein [Cognataquiflexum nitidum]MCH6198331.1 NAD-dependent epimerase/dehydratase family protein [Cognataquiflexum nitidum]